MPRLSLAIDRLTALLKWPACLLAWLAIAPAGLTWFHFAGLIPKSSQFWLPAALGVALYTIFHAISVRLSRHNPTRFFETFEHEFTHLIFALLSFKAIERFEVTRQNGGHIAYRGEANWIISLSPYFFPLLPLLFIFAQALIPALRNPYGHAAFGALLALHCMASIHEFSPRQTDLTRTGLLFSFAILPPLNFLIGSLLLAFATLGPSGPTLFFNYLLQNTHSLLSHFIN